MISFRRKAIWAMCAGVLLSVSALSADSQQTAAARAFLYSDYLNHAESRGDEISIGSFVVNTPRAVLWADGKRITDKIGNAINALPVNQWLMEYYLEDDADISARWKQSAAQTGWDLTELAVDESVMAVAEGAYQRGFIRNLEVDLQSEFGGRFAQAGLNALGALRETDNNVVAWQLRGYVGNNRSGGNAGLIYRHTAGNTLWGANVFTDYETEQDEGFWRWSTGVEARSPWLDIFANYYSPLSDGLATANLDEGAISYTYTAGGYDVEFNLHAPKYSWLVGVAEYYVWDGEFGRDDDEGYRAGVRVQSTDSPLLWEVLYQRGETGVHVGSRLSFQHEIGKSYGGLAEASPFRPQDWFFASVSREYSQRIYTVRQAPDGAPYRLTALRTAGDNAFGGRLILAGGDQTTLTVVALSPSDITIDGILRDSAISAVRAYPWQFPELTATLQTQDGSQVFLSYQRGASSGEIAISSTVIISGLTLALQEGIVRVSANGAYFVETPATITVRVGSGEQAIFTVQVTTPPGASTPQVSVMLISGAVFINGGRTDCNSVLSAVSGIAKDCALEKPVFTLNESYDNPDSNEDLSIALSGGAIIVNYLETIIPPTTIPLARVRIRGGDGSAVLSVPVANPNLRFDVTSGALFLANGVYTNVVSDSTVALTVRVRQGTGAALEIENLTITVIVIGREIRPLSATFSGGAPANGNTAGTQYRITGFINSATTIAVINARNGADSNYQYALTDDSAGNFSVDSNGALILQAAGLGASAVYEIGDTFGVTIAISDTDPDNRTADFPLMLFMTVASIDYPNLVGAFDSNLSLSNGANSPSPGTSRNRYTTNRRHAELATFTATGGSNIYRFTTNTNGFAIDDSTGVLTFENSTLPNLGNHSVRVSIFSTTSGGGITVDTTVLTVHFMIFAAPVLGANVLANSAFADDTARRTIGTTGNTIGVVLHEVLSLPLPGSLTAVASLEVTPGNSTIVVTFIPPAGVITYNTALSVFNLNATHAFYSATATDAPKSEAAVVSIRVMFDGETDFDLYTLLVSIAEISPIAAAFTGGVNVPAGGNAATNPHNVVGFFNVANTLATISIAGGVGDDIEIGGTSRGYVYTKIGGDLELTDGNIVLPSAAGNYAVNTNLGITVRLEDTGEESTRTADTTLILFVRVTAITFSPVLAIPSSSFNGDGSAASPYRTITRADADLARITLSGGDGDGYQLSLISGASIFSLAATTAATGEQSATLRFGANGLPTSTGVYTAVVRIDEPVSSGSARITLRFRVQPPAPLSAGLAVNAAYHQLENISVVLISGASNRRVRVGYLESRAPDTNAHFALLTIGGGSGEATLRAGAINAGLNFNAANGELRFAAGVFLAQATNTIVMMTAFVEDPATRLTLEVALEVVVVGEQLAPIAAAFNTALTGAGSAASPLRITGAFGTALTVLTVATSGGEEPYTFAFTSDALTFNSGASVIVLPARTAAHSFPQTFTGTLIISDTNTAQLPGGGGPQTADLSLTLHLAMATISYPALALTFGNGNVAVGDGTSTSPWQTNRRLAKLTEFTVTGGAGGDYDFETNNTAYDISGGTLKFTNDILPATGIAQVLVSAHSTNDGGMTVASASQIVFVDVRAAPLLGVLLVPNSAFADPSALRTIAAPGGSDVAIRAGLHEVSSYPVAATINALASLEITPSTGATIVVSIIAATGNDLIRYDSTESAFYLNHANTFYDTGGAKTGRVTISIDLSFEGADVVELYTVEISVEAIAPLAATFIPDPALVAQPLVSPAILTTYFHGIFPSDRTTLGIARLSGGAGALTGGSYSSILATPSTVFSTEAVPGTTNEFVLYLLSRDDAPTLGAGNNSQFLLTFDDSGSGSGLTPQFSSNLFVSEITAIISPPVAAEISSPNWSGDGTPASPFGPITRSDRAAARVAASGGDGAGYVFEHLGTPGAISLEIIGDFANLRFVDGLLPQTDGLYTATVKVSEPDSGGDPLTLAVILRVDAPAPLAAAAALNPAYQSPNATLSLPQPTRITISYLETAGLETSPHFASVTISGGSGDVTFATLRVDAGLSLAANGRVSFVPGVFLPIITERAATISLTALDNRTGRGLTLALTVQAEGNALPPLSAQLGGGFLATIATGNAIGTAAGVNGDISLNTSLGIVIAAGGLAGANGGDPASYDYEFDSASQISVSETGVVWLLPSTYTLAQMEGITISVSDGEDIGRRTGTQELILFVSLTINAGVPLRISHSSGYAGDGTESNPYGPINRADLPLFVYDSSGNGAGSFSHSTFRDGRFLDGSANGKRVRNLYESEITSTGNGDTVFFGNRVLPTTDGVYLLSIGIQAQGGPLVGNPATIFTLYFNVDYPDDLEPFVVSLSLALSDETKTAHGISLTIAADGLIRHTRQEGAAINPLQDRLILLSASGGSGIYTTFIESADFTDLEEYTNNGAFIIHDIALPSTPSETTAAATVEITDVYTGLVITTSITVAFIVEAFPPIVGLANDPADQSSLTGRLTITVPGAPGGTITGILITATASHSESRTIAIVSGEGGNGNIDITGGENTFRTALENIGYTPGLLQLSPLSSGQVGQRVVLPATGESEYHPDNTLFIDVRVMDGLQANTPDVSLYLFVAVEEVEYPDFAAAAVPTSLLPGDGTSTLPWLVRSPSAGDSLFRIPVPAFSNIVISSRSTSPPFSISGGNVSYTGSQTGLHTALVTLEYSTGRGTLIATITITAVVDIIASAPGDAGISLNTNFNTDDADGVLTSVQLIPGGARILVREDASALPSAAPFTVLSFDAAGDPSTADTINAILSFGGGIVWDNVADAVSVDITAAFYTADRPTVIAASLLVTVQSGGQNILTTFLVEVSIFPVPQIEAVWRRVSDGTPVISTPANPYLVTAEINTDSRLDALISPALSLFINNGTNDDNSVSATIVGSLEFGNLFVGGGVEAGVHVYNFAGTVSVLSIDNYASTVEVIDDTTLPAATDGRDRTPNLSVTLHFRVHTEAAPLRITVIGCGVGSNEGRSAALSCGTFTDIFVNNPLLFRATGGDGIRENSSYTFINPDPNWQYENNSGDILPNPYTGRDLININFKDDILPPTDGIYEFVMDIRDNGIPALAPLRVTLYLQVDAPDIPLGFTLAENPDYAALPDIEFTNIGENIFRITHPENITLNSTLPFAQMTIIGGVTERRQYTVNVDGIVATREETPAIVYNFVLDNPPAVAGTSTVVATVIVNDRNTGYLVSLTMTVEIISTPLPQIAAAYNIGVTSEDTPIVFSPVFAEDYPIAQIESSGGVPPLLFTEISSADSGGQPSGGLSLNVDTGEIIFPGRTVDDAPTADFEIIVAVSDANTDLRPGDAPQLQRTPDISLTLFAQMATVIYQPFVATIQGLLTTNAQGQFVADNGNLPIVAINSNGLIRKNTLLPLNTHFSVTDRELEFASGVLPPVGVYPVTIVAASNVGIEEDITIAVTTLAVTVQVLAPGSSSFNLAPDRFYFSENPAADDEEFVRLVAPTELSIVVRQGTILDDTRPVAYFHPVSTGVTPSTPSSATNNARILQWDLSQGEPYIIQWNFLHAVFAATRAAGVFTDTLSLNLTPSSGSQIAVSFSVVVSVVPLPPLTLLFAAAEYPDVPPTGNADPAAALPVIAEIGRPVSLARIAISGGAGNNGTNVSTPNAAPFSIVADGFLDDYLLLETGGYAVGDLLTVVAIATDSASPARVSAVTLSLIVSIAAIQADLGITVVSMPSAFGKNVESPIIVNAATLTALRSSGDPLLTLNSTGNTAVAAASNYTIINAPAAAIFTIVAATGSNNESHLNLRSDANVNTSFPLSIEILISADFPDGLTFTETETLYIQFQIPFAAEFTGLPPQTSVAPLLYRLSQLRNQPVATVALSGGTPPYTYNEINDSLPLRVDSSGIIRLAPNSQLGTATISIHVSDGEDNLTVALSVLIVEETATTALNTNHTYINAGDGMESSPYIVPLSVLTSLSIQNDTTRNFISYAVDLFVDERGTIASNGSMNHSWLNADSGASTLTVSISVPATNTASSVIIFLKDVPDSGDIPADYTPIAAATLISVVVHSTSTFSSLELLSTIYFLFGDPLVFTDPTGETPFTQGNGSPDTPFVLEVADTNAPLITLNISGGSGTYTYTEIGDSALEIDANGVLQFTAGQLVNSLHIISLRIEDDASPLLVLPVIHISLTNSLLNTVPLSVQFRFSNNRFTRISVIGNRLFYGARSTYQQVIDYMNGTTSPGPGVTLSVPLLNTYDPDGFRIVKIAEGSSKELTLSVNASGATLVVFNTLFFPRYTEPALTDSIGDAVCHRIILGIVDTNDNTPYANEVRQTLNFIAFTSDSRSQTICSEATSFAIANTVLVGITGTGGTANPYLINDITSSIRYTMSGGNLPTGLSYRTGFPRSSGFSDDLSISLVAGSNTDVQFAFTPTIDNLSAGTFSVTILLDNRQSFDGEFLSTLHFTVAAAVINNIAPATIAMTNVAGLFASIGTRSHVVRNTYQNVDDFINKGLDTAGVQIGRLTLTIPFLTSLNVAYTWEKLDAGSSPEVFVDAAGRISLNIDMLLAEKPGAVMGDNIGLGICRRLIAVSTSEALDLRVTTTVNLIPFSSSHLASFICREPPQAFQSSAVLPRLLGAGTNADPYLTGNPASSYARISLSGGNFGQSFTGNSAPDAAFVTRVLGNAASMLTLESTSISNIDLMQINTANPLLAPGNKMTVTLFVDDRHTYDAGIYHTLVLEAPPAGFATDASVAGNANVVTRNLASGVFERQVNAPTPNTFLLRGSYQSISDRMTNSPALSLTAPSYAALAVEWEKRAYPDARSSPEMDITSEGVPFFILSLFVDLYDYADWFDLDASDDVGIRGNAGVGEDGGGTCRRVVTEGFVTGQKGFYPSLRVTINIITATSSSSAYIGIRDPGKINDLCVDKGDPYVITGNINGATPATCAFQDIHACTLYNANVFPSPLPNYPYTRKLRVYTFEPTGVNMTAFVKISGGNIGDNNSGNYINRSYRIGDAFSNSTGPLGQNGSELRHTVRSGQSGSYYAFVDDRQTFNAGPFYFARGHDAALNSAFSTYPPADVRAFATYALFERVGVWDGNP